MELVDGAIHFTGWIGPSTPERCKAVGGGRWSPARKAWVYPLDFDTCRRLREQFGPPLQIGPELEQWARREQVKQRRLTQLHMNLVSEPIEMPLWFQVQAPTIWAAMRQRGYQTLVPYFADRVGNYFNGSQPGCGKTIETFASMVRCRVGRRILVIAPSKSLRATWAQQIGQWLATDMEIDYTIADSEMGDGEDREELLVQFNKRSEEYEAKDSESIFVRLGIPKYQILLINAEMARIDMWCVTGKCNGKSKRCPDRSKHRKTPWHPALFAKPWDLIVLDETHKYMVKGNERSASVSQVAMGIQKLPVVKGAKLSKIGLSGTPFKGKLRKFWPVLHWLRPDKYTSQRRWEDRYFKSTDNFFAHGGKSITDELRPEMERMLWSELDQITIRHTKAELHRINPNWAPPDKQFVKVVLDMHPKQRRAYEQMARAAVAEVRGGTLMANGILAEITRLKQLASSAGKMVDEDFSPALPSCKWDWIRNVFLAERGILDGEGSIKVGIISQYTQILDMYGRELDRLKVPYFQIDGSTRNVEEIQAIWQRKYRKGDPRVLLLSTMAGGTSLNLDAADDAVLNDQTPIPDDQEQAVDRFHRTSRTDHQVTVYVLMASETIDVSVAANNLQLDQIQKRVLDERRGVEFMTELVGGELINA